MWGIQQKELKECIIVMQMDNLFIVKQPPRAFFDREVNIKAMKMFGIKLGHGHFNKRL